MFGGWALVLQSPHGVLPLAAARHGARDTHPQQGQHVYELTAVLVLLHRLPHRALPLVRCVLL
jgi:hypothetical protein